MSQETPLTPEEAAQILKISKYTLYELVKRGEIPAQRIGRQLRFDPETIKVLSLGKVQSKEASGEYLREPAKETSKELARGTKNPQTQSDLIFAGSHEPVVELLQEFLKHSLKPLNLSLSFNGSMEGLIMLYKREAALAGVHLWDSMTQEYNIPFVQHILPGEQLSIVNLVQRTQGWIVPSGNPLNLTAWSDIAKGGLRFVNRQKGSGTRIRLDSYLHSAHISPLSIQGYAREENTHFGVACRVANGEVDAGIGVQAVAQRLGLDFYPLFQERYDLVCLEETYQTPAWQQILSILQSPAFHKAINQNVGYNTSLTGQILYQTE